MLDYRTWLNWVPKLNPMGGSAPWVRSTEVKTHEACGRCGGSIKSHTEVCLACLRVSPRNEQRLKNQLAKRAKKKTAPKFQPKIKDKKNKGETTAYETDSDPRLAPGAKAEVFTRKERRWAYRKAIAMGAQGQEWLKSIGLEPPAKEPT